MSSRLFGMRQRNMGPRLQTSKLKFKQLKEKKLQKALGMLDVKRDFDLRNQNGGGEFGFTFRDDEANQFRLKGTYDRKRNVNHLTLSRVGGQEFVLPVMGPKKLGAEVRRRIDLMRRQGFQQAFDNRMEGYVE